MPAPTDKAYTADHVVGADNSVAFTCSGDASEWPWLELPPQHPLVLMTQSFWISVGGAMARGTLDPSKWSALTWVDWAIGDPAAGHGTHGIMEDTDIDGAPGFAITLRDAQERLVYRMRGKGVVFRNRNFEGWRAASKDALAPERPKHDFEYAPGEAVGVAAGEFALISPLEPDGEAVTALVTAANGMPPASRQLSGSGDHVNATHIGECARQFTALLTGDPQVAFSAGEIRFDRYIEMEVPFRIECAERSSDGLRLLFSQADRQCSEARLRFA